MTDDWSKQAERVRELSRDPAASAYLLAAFCAGSTATELADLVQAALVYRERFGADSNDHRQACLQAVSHVEKCDACAHDIVAVCAAALGIRVR